MFCTTPAWAAYFPGGKGALPGFVNRPTVTAGGGNATATLGAQCGWNECTDENRLANGVNSGSLTITSPPATSMFDGEYVYVSVSDTGTGPSSINWLPGAGVTLASTMTGDVGTIGGPTACFGGPTGKPPATGTVFYLFSWDSSRQVLSLLGCKNDPPGAVATVPQGGTDQTSSQAARGASGLNVESITLQGPTSYSIQTTDREVDTLGPWTAPTTWTLPPANSVNPGQLLRILDDNFLVSLSNSLTILPAGADTIAFGLTGVTMNSAGETILLNSDGISQWRVTDWNFAPAFYTETPVAGQEVSGFKLPYDVYFPANLNHPTSRGSWLANPNTADTYTLYCTNTALATITLTTNGTSPTFATTGGTFQQCNANQRLRIVAPTPLPTTPETGVSFTIIGFHL